MTVDEEGMASLRGKVAIVTGSTRGLGYGIACRFAKVGVAVVVNGRFRVAVDKAASAVNEAGGVAVGIAADVGNAGDVRRLFDETIERLGPPDILVNNAAVTNSVAVAHFLETDEARWDETIRSNLKSVYLCSHRAANDWVDAGRAGVIVNVSSFSAQRAHRCLAAYDASKGGLEALSRAMAIDLAPFGIRVNVVAPGAIDVEEHLMAPAPDRLVRAQQIPLGRAGVPADIAAAVQFLVSQDASYITGQTLVVDGGVLAQLRTPDVDIRMPDSVRRRMALAT
jgi:NAD(P)-dependent dehydrogenase (short-subunit alcohol dehydrogenase family)